MMIYGFCTSDIEISMPGICSLIEWTRPSIAQLRIEDAYEDLLDFNEKNCKDFPVTQAVEKWLALLDYDGIDVGVVIASAINKVENLSLKCIEDVVGIELCLPWEVPDNMKDMTEQHFMEVINRFWSFISAGTAPPIIYRYELD